MSDPLEVHQVDVFTSRRFEGNPAGVVLGAEGLTDSFMLHVAREMNLSETAFVFPARKDESGGALEVIPVRFFTPRCEVPLCGHATLGAHAVRAWSGGQDRGAVVQDAPGGRWEVRWEPRDGRLFVTMMQGPVEERRRLDDRSEQTLLRALGAEDEVVDPAAGLLVLTTGHAKVLVRIRTEQALGALVPDMAALEAWSRTTGIGGILAFVTIGSGSTFQTAARVFAPALGIPEDPVNGSGHGPLGAWLDRAGGELHSAARAGFWSRMGESVGRPGRVWTRVLEGGRMVEVGGDVTPVFQTRIDRPHPGEAP